jgi:hypothetical protein
MPFEKFKPPKIHGVIGTQIGKLNGVVLSKGLTATSQAANALRKPECPSPAELAQISAKLAGLSSLSTGLTSNLGAFKALPGAIKGPVSGILAVVNTIIKLPVPQAIGIPPGPAGGLILGLPTAFTTNFADILNLMKEFAIAMLITADAIEGCLKDVSGSTSGMSARVSEIGTPIAVCKISNTVKSKLNKKQQKELGIIDDDGNNVLDSFGSKVLKPENTDSPKSKLEKDLAKKVNLPKVYLKGKKSLSDLPASGPKLNVLREGDAFRLPVEKLNGKVINKFAVIISKKEDTGAIIQTPPSTIQTPALSAKKKLSKAGVPEKEIRVVELDIDPSSLTGKAQAFAQLDNVLRNISDKLTKIDTSDSKLKSKNIPITDSEKDSQLNKKGNRLNEFDNFSNTKKIDPNNSNQANVAVQGLQSSIGKLQKNLTDSIPLDILKELKEDLAKLTDNLIEKESSSEDEDSNNDYKGYTLKIQRTNESPILAPRHYATGEKNGIVYFKGPDSYSSSKEILLEEIKFKIDNQLS